MCLLERIQHSTISRGTLRIKRRCSRTLAGTGITHPRWGSAMLAAVQVKVKVGLVARGGSEKRLHTSKHPAWLTNSWRNSTQPTQAASTSAAAATAAAAAAAAAATGAGAAAIATPRVVMGV